MTAQQEASSVVSEPDSEPAPGRSLHGILLHQVIMLPPVDEECILQGEKSESAAGDRSAGAWHWTALFHGSPRWPAQTGDAEERLLTAEIGREAAVTWSCSIVELHPESLIWPCNAVLVLSSSWRPRAG